MKIPLITSIILFFFVPIFSTTWTVDDDSTAQFVKIQDAIDAAYDGDTILVLNGLYEECIEIPKSIFLIGENNQQSIVSSDQSKSWTILIMENSTIKDLKINNGKYGIYIDSKGMILNNVIANNEKGIFVPFRPSSHNDVLIYENDINNNIEGIFFDVQYPGSPDTIKVIGNSIYDNDYGIVYFPEQICCGPPFDTTWNVDADSNYWGYNAADSIAESIWDKNDSEKAIARLHYEYWYSDSIETQSVNISTGIHHNNIYDNSLYNVYAFNDQGTGLDDQPVMIPVNINLFQNYPNPFNSSTTIPYTVNYPAYITISVYDVQGRNIKTLVNDLKNPGMYTVQFNAEHLSTGLYYYQMKGGGEHRIKKMLYIK